jgi:hypothetical protein
MADNYVQFSEVVPALTAEEQGWVERTLGGDDDADLGRILRKAGIRTRDVDPDDWPGFEWEVAKPGNDLWLYAQGSSNAAHAGQFVRALLARFRPGDCWSLAWAETCCRPRVGEFGGGRLFVTADCVRVFTAAGWLAERRRAFAQRDGVSQEVPQPASRRRRRRRSR